MATTRIASSVSTTSLTLKQKADLIRAQRNTALPVERRNASWFETIGFAAGDVMNGFGTTSDAYTVRRSERS